jgi:hypothetical protein
LPEPDIVPLYSTVGAVSKDWATNNPRAFAIFRLFLHCKPFDGSNWNDKYAFETTLQIAGLIRHDIINSVPGICRRMSSFSETS